MSFAHALPPEMKKNIYLIEKIHIINKYSFKNRRLYIGHHLPTNYSTYVTQ